MLQFTQSANEMFDFQRRRVAVWLFTFGLLAAGLLVPAAPAAAQNTVPDAELNLDARPGERKVSLHFKEPDDGGAPITHYEYQAKVATGTYPTTWTRVPEFTGNVGATLDLYVVVEQLSDGTALANGTKYAFQVRAVNSEGAGMPGEAMATPQANVPATYTIGPEQGIIERRPFAPAPRVPADQSVSLLGAITDPDKQDVADSGDDRFTYEWEWIRVRAGSETVIAGAGAAARGDRTSGYVLTHADTGFSGDGGRRRCVGGRCPGAGQERGAGVQSQHGPHAGRCGADGLRHGGRFGEGRRGLHGGRGHI